MATPGSTENTTKDRTQLKTGERLFVDIASRHSDMPGGARPLDPDLLERLTRLRDGAQEGRVRRPVAKL